MAPVDTTPAPGRHDPDFGGSQAEGAGVPLVDITLVEAPACHLCEQAKSALAVLAQSFPMTIHALSIDDEAGRAHDGTAPGADESPGSAGRAVLQLRKASQAQARAAAGSCTAW